MPPTTTTSAPPKVPQIIDLGPLVHGLVHIALSFWPLWTFLLLFWLGKQAVEIRDMRRIGRSGIDDIDAMDGRAFEVFLSIMFSRLGYEVELTQYRGDYGADLVIAIDGRRIAVQAKRWKKRVGVTAVQEAVAAKGLYRCASALVVTNSRFTNEANTLARANDVTLWDRDILISKCIEAMEKPAATPPLTGEPHCAICREPVSPRVVAYCRARTDRFGGRIYCYDHQGGFDSPPASQPSA